MSLFSRKQTSSSEPEEEEAYAVYPILPGTDYREHTPEHPFCGDMNCPCHEDEDNVAQLGQYHHEGLVSSGDADRIYRGRTL